MIGACFEMLAIWARVCLDYRKIMFAAPLLYNFLLPYFKNVRNKHKSLLLQVFHSNLSDAPHLGRILALPTNIKQSWKSLLGENTLAYYKHQLFKGRRIFK